MEWRQINLARQILASETGAIVRDWGGQLPIVLAYPNSYAVGMSSLATHTLYRWLNAQEGIVCERAFATLDRSTVAHDEPITIESQRPLTDAAVIAFSVSFEMDYFHIIQMLQQAQIPTLAEERGDTDPLVIMGGPAVSANPAPMAPIADAIFVGEIEPVLADFVHTLRETWSGSRQEMREALALLPGMYVPLLHQGQTIARQWLSRMDDFPTTTAIYAPQATFGDMHLMEISRGCGRGCRFCLAGFWYRPRREYSLALLLEQARLGLQHRRKIGLVASAVSDYSHIEELVQALGELGAEISVSSLRVRPLSETLVRALADSGSRSITLAPEAGSERLRRAIHKGISHDDILHATEMAAHYGFDTLKLYFMLGLPGEEEVDIKELIALAIETKRLFGRNVVVNTTPFVPKAHTPFQRVAMAPTKILDERIKQLDQILRRAGIQHRSEAVKSARIQAVLARGDERIGRILAAMPQPQPNRLERALKQQDMSIDGQVDERAAAARLPWDLVDADLPPQLLEREWQRARLDMGDSTCSEFAGATPCP